MKRHWLLLVLLMLLAASGRATHIAGGELYLEPVFSGSPRLDVRLILYFDNVTGEAAALPQLLTCGVYQKSNNNQLGLVSLGLTLPARNVPLANPACASRFPFALQAYEYRGTFNYSPAFLALPQSAFVYFSVRHTARNRGVTNLDQSQVQGMVYYAESSIQNLLLNLEPGTVVPRFRNSTLPAACLGQRFSYNLGATMASADSITYHLVPALGGIINTGNDFPLPGPYDSAIYAPGFNSRQFVRTLEPINLDRHNGWLRINPSQPGVYLFAVEARGWQFGQVAARGRREMQLLVYDCARQKGFDTFVRQNGQVQLYDGSELLVFSGNDPSACVEIGLKPQLEAGVLSLAFSGRPTAPLLIDPPLNTRFANVNDTLWTKFCGPVCNTAANRGYGYRLSAFREDCPEATTDSIRMFFFVNPVTQPSLQVQLQSLQGVLGADTTLLLPFSMRVSEPLPLSWQFLLNGRAVAPGAVTVTNRTPRQLDGELTLSLNCQQLEDLRGRASLQLNGTATGRCIGAQASSTLALPIEQASAAGGKLPTVVTANGDGINDCWPNLASVSHFCPGTVYRVTITNRWGQAVYSAEGPNPCWEGKEQNAGVYFFQLERAGKVERGVVTLLK